MSPLSNSFRNSGRRLTRGQWAVLGVVILSDLCGIAAIALGYFDIGRTLIGLSLVAIAPYRYWTRRTNRPVAAEVGAKNAGLVRADERQGAMELVLDPTYVRIWAATSSAIDAAAGQRLDSFNDETLALYEDPGRGLAFMFAHLTLIAATKDLVGHRPAREDIDTLAERLEPEWNALYMADAVHLLNALVCANLGNSAGRAVFETTPRLEHTLAAAALVLRHLQRPTDFYREHVAGVMERNGGALPPGWLGHVSQG